MQAWGGTLAVAARIGGGAVVLTVLGAVLGVENWLAVALDSKSNVSLAEYAL